MGGYTYRVRIKNKPLRNVPAPLPLKIAVQIPIIIPHNSVVHKERSDVYPEV